MSAGLPIMDALNCFSVSWESEPWMRNWGVEVARTEVVRKLWWDATSGREGG